MRLFHILQMLPFYRFFFCVCILRERVTNNACRVFASSSSSLQGSSLSTVTLTLDTTTPLAFYPPNRTRQLDTLKPATEAER